MPWGVRTGCSTILLLGKELFTSSALVQLSGASRFGATAEGHPRGPPRPPHNRDSSRPPARYRLCRPARHSAWIFCVIWFVLSGAPALGESRPSRRWRPSAASGPATSAVYKTFAQLSPPLTFGSAARIAPGATSASAGAGSAGSPYAESPLAAPCTDQPPPVALVQETPRTQLPSSGFLCRPRLAPPLGW